MQVNAQPRSLGILYRHDRQTDRIIIGKGLELPGVRTQDLTKVPLLIKQSDSNDRYTQITGGFQMITGEDPQSTRINGEGLAQAELHTEVSYAGQSGRAMGPAEPPGILKVLPALFHPHAQIGLQGLIPGRFFQACLGNILKNKIGIPCQPPPFRV